MKTLKSAIHLIIPSLALLFVWPLQTNAQGKSPNSGHSEQSEMRPTQSDSTSNQLIENYLTITGGQQKHQQLLNVTAQGLIKESTLQRRFELIETNDGKRHITYDWTHLGRHHKVIYVYDGLKSWTQVLEPKRQEAKPYTGATAIHFSNQHWLLHPFTLPMRAAYVFKYQGTAKAVGRPAYLVKAFGKQNTASWFYFDKENHLLTRWGGEGLIAGTKEYLDYRATAFKTFDGILLPIKMDLLAENAVFGHIQFEQIQINQNLDQISFLMPASMIPTLRQRSITPPQH
jgi:hypothetical protein